VTCGCCDGSCCSCTDAPCRCALVDDVVGVVIVDAAVPNIRNVPWRLPSILAIDDESPPLIDSNLIGKEVSLIFSNETFGFV
jgi:hypothetical protein